MRRRCRWCGVFVRADTKLTERVLRVSGLPVRRVAQLLCPSCSRAWSVDWPSNRPAAEQPDLPLEILS